MPDLHFPAFIASAAPVTSVCRLAGGADWLPPVDSLAGAVEALLDQLDPERGYLAVMAYLDRIEHAPLEGVRERLAARVGRPVTFGWGPRFLHSTGQFHKGGPKTGRFLQIVDEPAQDLEVPGEPFTFATLIRAQADGDLETLRSHGLPAVRIDVKDLKEL